MPGGKIVYVPMHPPKTGAEETSSAGEWSIDYDELERAITPKTKMMVLNTPRKYDTVTSIFCPILTRESDNPVGKVFRRDELEKIAALCLKHHIIILSDEVYDRLYYVPFTRIATLSPEIENITLTVGSAGKNFYATGWRVGGHS
jgi:kynurenine aminotransferase